MNKSVNYFALDETENALDYLRRADQFISEAQQDPMAWKWATIALHGALYGFAIAACPDGMTWKEPDEKKLSIDDFIQKRRVQAQRPMFPSDKARLISIDWAIEISLRQPGRATPGNKPYLLTDSQRQSWRQLAHVYRDAFMHFHRHRFVVPGIELPVVTREALGVIQVLISVRLTRVDHEAKKQAEKIIGHTKATLSENIERDEHVNLPA